MSVSLSDEAIKKAEAILGHTFEDKKLLERALTHPSAVENQPVWASYERLEFLGDSILGAIVATDLFEKFPEIDEGGLTRMKISLVSGETLSKVAKELGVAELILFGQSERGTGARGLHSALENVYEALLGALYLDAGYTKSHDFVIRTLSKYVSKDLAQVPIVPKSKLQEVAQRDYKIAPVYKLIESRGPAHNPTFTSAAFVGDKQVGVGDGSSKKESESAAALDALKSMGYLD